MTVCAGPAAWLCTVGHGHVCSDETDAAPITTSKLTEAWAMVREAKLTPDTGYLESMRVLDAAVASAFPSRAPSQRWAKP